MRVPDLSKHPDKCPIVIRTNSKNLPQVIPEKFLVHKKATIGKLIAILRNKINIPSFYCIFLSCENTILKQTDFIQNIYDRFHRPDGFLYFEYFEQ